MARQRSLIGQRAQAAADVLAQEQDDGYQQFQDLIRSRVGSLPQNVFTTNAVDTDLWRLFIGNTPAARRQHYNCNCCRRFIQKYGGLVSIDPSTGATSSVLWQPQGVYFALEGCRDSREDDLCLFPEILRSELREVRAVIEANNKQGRVERNPIENANGLLLTNSSPLQVRVITNRGRETYTLDRLD